MRKFSHWVYSWYEDNTFSSYQLHDAVPAYSDEAVSKKIKSWLNLDEGIKYKIKKLETALKNTLMPDDKVAYGVYDTTDYDYIEDLDDWGMDIPGYRDK